MIRLRVRERRRQQLLRGHLWVYDTDIAAADGTPAPGDPCRIESEAGEFLAVGYVHPGSVIAARVLSFRDEEPGEPLVLRRLAEALAAREPLQAVLDTDALRLANGEGDRLPGLVVDRFGRIAVLQANTAGIARHAERIAEFLLERGAESVVLRGDSPGLRKEGVPFPNRVVGAPVPELAPFREGRVTALFPAGGGQKTGAYLDIRPARRLFGPLAAGGPVLDVFCNSGLFGLHALAHGAPRVVFVESGKGPLALLEKNLERLPAEVRARAEILSGDAFALLPRLAEAGERFAAVVVDPPPFVLRRKDLARGRAAYFEVFRRGLNLVAPGGIMVAATCSAPVGAGELLEILIDASVRAGARFDVAFYGVQDLDHPFAPAMPETNYLKYYGVRRAGD